MNTTRTIGMKIAASLLAALGLFVLPANAQIQRTFVNLGFEQPTLTGSNCYIIFSADSVPGWNTNHTPNVVQGSCTFPGFPNGTAINRPIELWRGPNFNGVPPRTGSQHAELNAYEQSRMSQTICLTPGEQIDWKLSHRGRSSATTADVMAFNIDTGANQVALLSSTNNGGGAAPVCAANGSIGSPTCTVAAGGNGWRDYSGSFMWNGTGGNHNFGFEAISAAGGIAAGNFLDEIQVTLRPYVEFFPQATSSREGQALTAPTIRISGTVPSGGITVLATITGGTATLGTDYTTQSTTTTVNIPIAAGVYDNATFSVPIASIVNDTLVENNETVTIQLQPSPANYTLSSTNACGGTPVINATFTILDNDVDVRTTKSVSNATPAPGGTTVFTVTYQNNTARTTVGDATMHDATVTLADGLPTGITAFSWTCAASGTPAPVCPAASGSGAINTAATLPAGNGSSAGGTLTYTITATVAATQCAATTNTSTVTADAPVQEATASQSGFDTPVPGGTANNTATASVDPLCSDLAIFKTNTPANGPSDQASDTVVGGTATTYSLRVVNIGPDAVANARVTDTPGTGITCPGALGGTTVSCSASSSPAGATTCPAPGVLTTANLFGAGIQIPSLGVSPTPSAPNNFVTLTFTCTVD